MPSVVSAQLRTNPPRSVRAVFDRRAAAAQRRTWRNPAAARRRRPGAEPAGKRSRCSGADADACPAGTGRAHRAGRSRRALRDRPLWTRPAADHRRADLAGLSRPPGPGRRVSAVEGGPVGSPGLRAAARRLCRACQLRARERRQAGAAALGNGPRAVRTAGRRTARRRPGRRCAHPGGPDFVRNLQGQPVRAGRKTPARPERDDGRRRAIGGGHLSHRFELRRRQLAGALRHPRADRQAHRRHGDAPRRA